MNSQRRFIVKCATVVIGLILIASAAVVAAQQPPEQRAALNEAAVAFDAKGAAALEARLLTTLLNGSEDSPVTNVKLVVKNTTANFYTYVTGWATFYDNGGVRCGEGLFKADALAVGEAFETDTPGIRIRCSPSTWRIIATNLLPRVAPVVATAAPVSRSSTNLVISIDGEEHPLQIDRPLVLTLGNAQRTIVVRAAP